LLSPAFTCFILLMSRLLVVSHVPSANTQRLTGAVLSGARDASISGIEVRIGKPLETGHEEVLEADAIILGTTENFGYMSGAMKDFFDRIFYPCLEHTEAKPYALFIRAGQDGSGARTSIERIVAGLKWRAVQEPLICKGDVENFIEPCRELGMLMAAGLEGSIF
jgi:multimeric flavodoxin WrbA